MDDAEKNLIENEEEERGEIKKKREVGGIKPIPFILGNEISERFATTGFHGNMISYLTQTLNLPLVKASNTLTNFNGLAGFTPLLGGLIADSFAGRYWTIILGSSIYTLGLVSIIVSAVLPGLRPPPCPTQVDCKEATTFQLSILNISLLLTSLGLGGIRPCVITFAADQIGMSKSEAESRSWNFFNWYYFFLDLATLTAITLLVYVQDNVSWGWGLGIPTISMALSIVVFIIGSPLYKKEKPGGSPLVRLVQVIVASVGKRKEVVPEDSTLLYTNEKLDASISSKGRLLHTNDFKWFDKAAVVTDSDKKDSPNFWNLSTVHRVEELKSIIRMLPIWASGILVITAYSHQDSFSIQQARTMDRHLFHSNSFEIPPATMAVFNILTVLIGLMLYERQFVPLARRFTGHPAGITCLQRIGVGYTIGILGTAVSALVEIWRKSVAADYNLLDKPAAVPLSVLWLIPQYSIRGVSSLFFNVGRLEFFYDQSPESMRSTAASLFWIAIALGSYGGTLMVSLIHDYTSKKTNWIPNGNLNSGKLEYYYLFVSGLQVINLIYYFICTKFYTYKVLEEASDGADDGYAELATDDDNITSTPVEQVPGNGETLM